MQTIITLKLARQRLKKGEAPEDARELVDEALQSAENANQELRELARGILPGVLTSGGLPPALATIATRSPIPVKLNLRTEERFPDYIELTSYFVVSEAVANAAKHSSASAIQVALENRAGCLRLSVSDDGLGGADPARGSGLLGLRDRVEAAGGTLTLRSPPGEGTASRVRAPIGHTLSLRSMRPGFPLYLPSVRKPVLGMPSWSYFGPRVVTLSRHTGYSGGGIRTRDLRVMRSPKGGQVRPDGPCLLGFARVRWG